MDNRADTPGIIDVVDAGYEGKTKFIYVTRKEIVEKISMVMLSDMRPEQDYTSYDSGFLNGEDVSRLFGNSYNSANWTKLSELLMSLFSLIFTNNVSPPISRIDVDDALKTCSTRTDFLEYLTREIAARNH
ncbi:hypothetical protein FHX05_005985 [Rhizobium sp. BK491]|nr:hypothetical protein [Rhizobium sp. BK491]